MPQTAAANARPDVMLDRPGDRASSDVAGAEAPFGAVVQSQRS